MKIPSLLWLLLLALLVACGAEPESASGPELPSIQVAKPLQKEVVEWDEYTGRFRAVERVEVRARVNGYLDSVEFDDGQIVEKGDLLFVIDQRPFNIQLQSAQARYNLAEKEFKRAENLIADKVIPQEEYDQRQQELEVARAALAQASLDLEYTEVVAPISGRISTERVTPGNLINANSTLLTTIVSVDPIYFVFNASERDFLKYLRLDSEGTRPSSRSAPNQIYVKLYDEDEYRHVGHMDFLENEVDLGTGTMTGRAIFENADGLIYPGLTGRARLIGRPAYEAILVPESAIGTSQSNKFVLTLDAEDKVQITMIELGPLRDSDMRIVRSGLIGDERIVVNSLHMARPGTQVKPLMTELSEPETADDRLPVATAVSTASGPQASAKENAEPELQVGSESEPEAESESTAGNTP